MHVVKKVDKKKEEEDNIFVDVETPYGLNMGSKGFFILYFF